MKAELINPFLHATIKVFHSMLKVPLIRGRTILKETPMPSHDIAIFIAITGNYQGQAVYSMNFETIVKIVSILMPSLTRADIENEYKDVIGEMGNMITGNAVHSFVDSNADMNLDVPIVVDIRKQRPPVNNISTLSWNLYSKIGLVEVNIAINEKKKH